VAPIPYLRPDDSFKDWIASDLRFYREREGMSLAQLGLIMRASRHTVSNIEHARDGWNMNMDQAALLDEHFNLNAHFTRLVTYQRSAHDPDWFAEYAKYETSASDMRMFRLSIFPGLIQTPDYARALIAGAGFVKDVEAAVAERVKRRDVLFRETPPLVWIMLDETLLRRPIGGAAVMREQLRTLLDLIDLPHVTVQVVPRRTGFHLGLEGAFNVLRTPTKGNVAFVEAPGGGRLILSDTETREMEVRWARLGASALPWDVSRNMIAKAMEQTR
jgi:transcriptional regulator with XRE-family HTH domain